MTPYKISKITNWPTALAAFAMLLLFNSCEDVINVETDLAPQLLVVDGWINNKSEPQVIKLTLSQPYFESTFATVLTGANVTVTSSEGNTFNFVDKNDGLYTWTPEDGQNLGAVGTTFTLNIENEGKVYSAVSVLEPVPPIDSISQEFRTDDLRGPDGIYAQVYARDLLGLGNAYWIKTWKNGQFLNKPQELNIAFDAGFDPGAELDNLIFIPPIRELVNRLPDPDTEDNDDVAPWATGDSIYVEIHSINEPAFFFLNIARDQMANGDNTIFAIPLSNTTGNVISADPSEEVLGIFNVSAVSSMGALIE